MDVGPVELMVLVFPNESPGADVIRTLSEVVEQGYVTVLDLVVLTRTPDGDILVTDFDEDLDAAGFGHLQINGQALISEDDMDVVRSSLEPATSAAVIAYEQTWARGLAAAVRSAGGEVALHVQVPAQVVEAALAASVG
jgi:hypothetical protein